MRSKIWAGVAVVLVALAACDDDQGKRMETKTVTVTGSATAPVAPSGDVQTGEAVVRALYAEPTIPTDAATIRRFFTEEFVTGMVPPDGDVGPIDFDYRINGQDGEANGLTFAEIAGGPTGSVIVTRFTNGQPTEVTWTLCRQPSGALRIADASSPAKGEALGWDLRDLVGLPKLAEAC